MINFKIHIFIILGLFFNIFFGCTKVRESAGVSRKSPNEFNVIENPPLVVPPDFSLVAPQQLQNKDINNIEKDLAKEILFGLDEENIYLENQLSTMNKILSKSNAMNVSATIRDEIDTDFSNEINTNDIFQSNWRDETEILDAVKESERIRNKIFNNESIGDDDSSINLKKVKIKKKKRFIFF